MITLLAVVVGQAAAAPEVPTGWAWDPPQPFVVHAQLWADGYGVPVTAPGHGVVRAPAVHLEVVGVCTTQPKGKRLVTTCPIKQASVSVEAGLTERAHQTTEAWAAWWRQATVELTHTSTRKPTSLDVQLPVLRGLSTLESSDRQETDRLLGSALSMCVGFEVPAAVRVPKGADPSTTDRSWVQANRAGILPFPLVVHAGSGPRWRVGLRRPGSTLTAEGSARWTGTHIEDAVLTYIRTDPVLDTRSRLGVSCRVLEEEPTLDPPGSRDALPPFPVAAQPAP